MYPILAAICVWAALEAHKQYRNEERTYKERQRRLNSRKRDLLSRDQHMEIDADYEVTDDDEY